jgi:hypothetical protein
VRISRIALSYQLFNHEAKKISPPIFIRYLDLGSFREIVLPKEINKFISTHAVVENIFKILKHPEQYPPDICMASEENQITYGETTYAHS